MTTAQLAQRTDAFAKKYSGSYQTVDGNFPKATPQQPNLPYQCWDVAALFGKEVVGNQVMPTITGDAIGSFVHFPDPLPRFYTRHAISAVTPRKGDLIFWSINHVAIFLTPTGSNGFISLDQNWPIGSPIRETAHSWLNVAGILRPITTEEDMINNTDNEYARWRLLGWFIRGRELTRAEFVASAVGRSWLNAMEILCDSPEAQTAFNWQTVGMTAVRDNWQGQIEGLIKQVEQTAILKEELASRPTKEAYKALQDQIDSMKNTAQQSGITPTPGQASITSEVPAKKPGLLDRLLAVFVKPTV